MISNKNIDRETFADLYELLNKRDWISELFDELMDLWDLCDNRQQHKLLKELILVIEVLDSKGSKKACRSIDRQVKKWGLDPSNTFFVAVADLGKPDGSLVGLQQLKLEIQPIEEWESRFISHIPDSMVQIESGNSIIFFDDFIGSGNKMIKKFNWFCDELEEKCTHINLSSLNIYFVSFAGMAFGIKHLQDTLGKPVFTKLSLLKGISERNSGIQITEKLDEMRRLEQKLDEQYSSRNLEKYSLGYSKSETLYFWEGYSCPNNVFPVFWWPKIKEAREHRTILKRAN
jgi:hypothetical protein